MSLATISGVEERQRSIHDTGNWEPKRPHVKRSRRQIKTGSQTTKATACTDSEAEVDCKVGTTRVSAKLRFVTYC